MENARITVYSSKDQEAVKKLITRELKRFGFGYQHKYDFDLDDPEKYYINTGGAFYVLKISNQVIGSIAIINKGQTAELKRFYVHHDFQGQGYGSLLLNQAIKFCEEKEFKKIEFETNKKFKKAHSIYLSKGFNIAREDEDSSYMEKQLIKNWK